MENRMETALMGLYRGILHWGDIGIMEKKTETIMYRVILWGYIRVYSKLLKQGYIGDYVGFRVETP